jgi:cell division protein FtsB
VLLAAGLITWVLLGPIMRTMESRRELSRAQSELEKERARTQELQERKERALSDEFVEKEARKMGYVKPGEIPIIVLESDEQGVKEESPTDSPSSGNPEG